MGFSTYIQTVNRGLRRTGQSVWSDNTAFNNNDGQEIQVQGKDIVDEVNRRFLRLSRGRFLRRTHTVSATSSSNAYDGPSGTTAERYVEGSWRITAPTDKAFGPLEYMSEQDWNMLYPAGETVKGIPQKWILLTRTATDKDQIAFSPPADDDYTIKFEYYLGPYVLSQATDTLIWPEHVEDLLWKATQYELEAVLAEGKSLEVASKVDEIFSEIEQLTREPTDALSVVDLGIEISPFGGYTRDF